MTIQRTDIFVHQYLGLRPDIRKQVDRQLARLLTNPRHPGLAAKKMAGHYNVWGVRVDLQHRFTIQVTGQAVLIRKVGTHDVLGEP